MLDTVSTTLCDQGGIGRAKAGLFHFLCECWMSNLTESVVRWHAVAVGALLDTTSEEDVIALMIPRLSSDLGSCSVR